MIQLIHDTYGNAFTLVWSLGEGGNIFNTGLYNSISKNQSVFASFYRSIENSAKNQLASLIADDEIVREQMQREYAASGLSK